jgi:hypothetical protein
VRPAACSWSSAGVVHQLAAKGERRPAELAGSVLLDPSEARAIAAPLRRPHCPSSFDRRRWC